MEQRQHTAETKNKGRWRRYLERMAKVNEREFGNRRPRCHNLNLS